MKNETNENISVEQDRFSILLRTEQTTIKNEVFPSIEKAIGSKRFKKWSETVDALGFPIIGTLVAGEGMALVLSGFESKNYVDVVAGAQIIALGAVVYNMGDRVDKAKKLAKRQLDKLQSFRRS